MLGPIATESPDRIQIVGSVQSIPQHLWQAHSSPFCSHAFWSALEHSGAIDASRGWEAQHLVLWRGGRAIAAMPLFVKTHNRGEYVFDHAWADAYRRYGLNYYPRLVTSVPFTPVAGERVWLASDVSLHDVLPALLTGVREIAKEKQASSWHGLFLDQTFLHAAGMPADASNEQNALPIRLARRTNVQFLWENHAYASFDDFLSRLTAKRRKSIKVERHKVAAQAIQCRWLAGDEIGSDDWAFFYQCYANTYHVRGQRPYLTEAFFREIGQSMPEHLALVIAEQQKPEGVVPIAAALFFKDQHTLYGRYWGAMQDVDCLHFEVCYYQGIDYAIRQGLQWFDPGTQGEHKLIRGFAPVRTHSLHWLAEPAFMDAVQDYVTREQVGVEGYFQEALSCLPYKQQP